MIADKETKKSRKLGFLRQISKNRLSIVGLIIVIFYACIAILGPFLTPYDPNEQWLDDPLSRPSREHFFGVDDLGRDILSRVLWGARVSLFVGIMSVTISSSVGIIIGLISGYYGKNVDRFILFLTDIALSFPSILLASLTAAILGPNLINGIFAISIGGIPSMIRMVRGSVLSVKERPYVEAAKSIGAKEIRIMFSHILPNCFAPILILSTVRLGTSILGFAGLGFLGLGAQPPTPEWGAMLNDARRFIISAPHVSIFPGMALALLVLGSNLLGDGLRDTLDPRLRT